MKMNGGNASIMRSSSFAMILPVIGFLMIMALFRVTHAQMDSSPSNEGSAIDQGIAYVLLLVALALTYLLH